MSKTNAPIRIESRRELFVDDTLIERFGEGAALRMHAPVRREVVFQADGPNDDAASGYYSLHTEREGRYLLYYRGLLRGGDESDLQTANLAVSDDGIHFERPELGAVDLADGGKNNVVWRGIQGHNFIPFIDRNPDCEADKRFKAVGGTGKNNLYALHSPDGIHWRLAQEEPLDIPGKFDSANVPFWDAEIGKYRLFGFRSDPCGTLNINLGQLEAPRELRLNYRCEPGGSIRAELVNNDQRTIEQAVALTGDELHAPVTWTCGAVLPANPQAGSTVRLHLDRAEVYAYELVNPAG